jgi:hypothetical protein
MTKTQNGEEQQYKLPAVDGKNEEQTIEETTEFHRPSETLTLQVEEISEEGVAIEDEAVVEVEVFGDLIAPTTTQEEDNVEERNGNSDEQEREDCGTSAENDHEEGKINSESAAGDRVNISEGSNENIYVGENSYGIIIDSADSSCDMAETREAEEIPCITPTASSDEDDDPEEIVKLVGDLADGEVMLLWEQELEAQDRGTKESDDDATVVVSNVSPERKNYVEKVKTVARESSCSIIEGVFERALVSRNVIMNCIF